MIILIGGGPCSGKSYVAQKLALHYRIPWISTDLIRSIMKTVAEKTLYEGLFVYENKDIKKYYRITELKKLHLDQIKQCEDVFLGVKKLLNSKYKWESFIVEGVALLPINIAQLINHNKKMIGFCISETREEKLQQTIENRGLWNISNKYDNDLKILETKWLTKFNYELERKALELNLFVFKNTYSKETIISIIEYINALIANQTKNISSN